MDINTPITGMATGMDIRTDAIKAHWDKRALAYAKSRRGYKAICSYGSPYLYNKYIDMIQKKAFYSVVRRLAVKDKKVLDMGCGVGRWCNILLRMGASVTGADISTEMIHEAKRVKGNHRVRFINQPVSKVNVPDKSFDVITCVTVLQHITDESEFKNSIKNIARIVKDGGRMFIMEVAPSNGQVKRLFNYHLSVRTEAKYLEAFKEAGLELERTYSTDIMPFKQAVISESSKMPKYLYYILIHAAMLMSLGIDLIFSGTRYFTKYSWHKVFLLKPSENKASIPQAQALA